MFRKSPVLTVYSATSSLPTSLMTSVWLVPISCISYLSLGTILLVPLYHVTGTFSLFSSQVKWHSAFSSTCCSDSVAVNSTGTSEIKEEPMLRTQKNCSKYIYLVAHVHIQVGNIMSIVILMLFSQINLVRFVTVHKCNYSNDMLHCWYTHLLRQDWQWMSCPPLSH